MLTYSSNPILLIENFKKPTQLTKVLHKKNIKIHKRHKTQEKDKHLKMDVQKDSEE